MSKSEKKHVRKSESSSSPIGLETKSSAELAEKLNSLLANYQLFYQNTRGFHWNIQGDDFFTLHIKFEELYTNLQLKIDEIAERVLTIGFTPLHTFANYLEESSIKAVKDVTNGKDAIKHILDAFKTIILKQRELLEISAKASDEGTNSLMSDYITEQEKLVWMYSAYLGK
jgi:starvation-inducible DNA-binding protein